MSSPVFMSYSPKDIDFANYYCQQLQSSGYTVILDENSARSGMKGQNEIQRAIISSLAVITLVSPDSIVSEWVMRECAWAQQYSRLLIPVLIRLIPELPWYLKEIQVVDGTMDFPKAVKDILEILPRPDSGMTFGEARDIYLQRATLKSHHTIDAYRRAIDLFFQFLQDRKHPGQILPIQCRPFTVAEELPLASLSADDAPILLQFAQWQLSPSSGNPRDKRPYKPATVELRVSGVQNWLQYLDDYGWLPPDFPLSKTKRIIGDELRNQTRSFKPPQPPEHIEEVIYYYDSQQPPKHLQRPGADQELVQRWELTRQRNCALLHALAETGGRISEILSLNLVDFPPRHLEQRDVVRVEVMGKGGHPYYLRFYDSLPAIRAYIHARGANLRSSLKGDVPLFASHDPRYDGSRMSRVVAWRIVQRASRALGLGSITPHDFRHWRATQLINAGHSLDVVQDYLGHRSVETTRSYYAHTDPLRVDEAAKNTRLPNPD